MKGHFYFKDDVVSEVLSSDITFHPTAQRLTFHRSRTCLTEANESKGLVLRIPHIANVLCYSYSDEAYKASALKN